MATSADSAFAHRSRQYPSPLDTAADWMVDLLLDVRSNWLLICVIMASGATVN
jgi:hypothetical protein